jgi:hypothetical protein
VTCERSIRTVVVVVSLASQAEDPRRGRLAKARPAAEIHQVLHASKSFDMNGMRKGGFEPLRSCDRQPLKLVGVRNEVFPFTGFIGIRSSPRAFYLALSFLEFLHLAVSESQQKSQQPYGIADFK